MLSINLAHLSFTAFRIAKYVAISRRGIWNYNAAKTLGIDCSTCIDTLKRLEKAGWLQSEQERVHQLVAMNRPLRIIYRMTDFGRSELERLSSLIPSSS